MRYTYIMNGSSLGIDGELCTGCGICREVCPHGVIAVASGGRARVVDRERCMECGACALNCPAGAIAVNRGVGCAAAVLAGKMGIRGSSCSCSCGPAVGNGEGKGGGENPGSSC
jgi:MinD superfamily P-loop ATPase containing an inserted ferredoxin domain